MYEIEYDKFKNVDLLSIKLIMIEIEKWINEFVENRIKKYNSPRKMIEEIEYEKEKNKRCK
jgi:hypothetical protein